MYYKCKGPSHFVEGAKKLAPAFPVKVRQHWSRATGEWIREDANVTTIYKTNEGKKNT
jgi:hypothetical protein